MQVLRAFGARHCLAVKPLPRLGPTQWSYRCYWTRGKPLVLQMVLERVRVGGGCWGSEKLVKLRWGWEGSRLDPDLEQRQRSRQLSLLLVGRRVGV